MTECVGDSTGPKFYREQYTDESWEIAQGEGADYHNYKKTTTKAKTRLKIVT